MSNQSKANFCCPACDRDIVNRAVDRCLYCGEPIPIELKFTKKEIQKNEKAYKKKLKNAEEKRKREKLMGVQGSGGPFDSGGDL